jgi:chemosensory pili system protein ChpA (sensor histidine kinase/response regulator)
MHSFLLVVDDDPEIRTLQQQALEDEGYHVHVANDGLDALEHLNSGVPKLVLLDLEMPLMDGLTFAAHLHRAGLRSRLRILVLSASSEGPQKARQLGADRYFEKPFDLTTVLDHVDRLLRCS